MGNVLENCVDNEVLLSDVKLNEPSDTICIRKPIYYVAGGRGKETINNIAVSTDGNKWTIIRKQVFDIICNGITYNNIQKKWVAVGRGVNTIATSTNGYDWTGLGNTIFLSSSGYRGGTHVKYANNLYVAVGDAPNNSIATSTDGDNWNGLGKTIFITGMIVKYANGLWVIGGIGGTLVTGGTRGANYQLVTSSNGTTWNAKHFVIGPLGPSGMSYGNGLWIVVCNSNNYTIKSTNNFDTWTKIQINIFSICYDICYSSNLWVIVGQGNNQIATSSDGNVWTGLGKTFFQYNGSTVNYLNGIWFVGGQNNITQNTTYNTIFSSINGNDWIPKVDYTILNVCVVIEYANPLLLSA
jgi:hypothetical protein